MNEPQHNIMDASAVAVILGSFAGYLPAIAAGLAAIWYIVQIYDRIKHGRKK